MFEPKKDGKIHEVETPEEVEDFLLWMRRKNIKFFQLNFGASFLILEIEEIQYREKKIIVKNAYGHIYVGSGIGYMYQEDDLKIFL
jgi:hypothetical protein